MDANAAHRVARRCTTVALLIVASFGRLVVVEILIRTAGGRGQRE